MLFELDIENYAVVDKLRVRFDRGLNLLTGETGSGKSIVVDALSIPSLERGGTSAGLTVPADRSSGGFGGPLCSAFPGVSLAFWA